MNCLLIIAHGSRNPVSTLEIENLAHEISHKTQKYDRVDHAFLELATPGIQQQIESLIQRGALSVSVLPYFLAAGNHVKKDIPQIMKKIQVKHPQITFNLIPHIGSNPGQADFILQHIVQMAYRSSD